MADTSDILNPDWVSNMFNNNNNQLKLIIIMTLAASTMLWEEVQHHVISLFTPSNTLTNDPEFEESDFWNPYNNTDYDETIKRHDPDCRF